MRETRSSGSVEWVTSNRDPYSDFPTETFRGEERDRRRGIDNWVGTSSSGQATDKPGYVLTYKGENCGENRTIKIGIISERR